jgi:hypothetical protein
VAREIGNKTAEGQKAQNTFMIPQKGLQINPNNIDFAKTMNISEVLSSTK